MNFGTNFYRYAKQIKLEKNNTIYKNLNSNITN